MRLEVSNPPYTIEITRGYVAPREERPAVVVYDLAVKDLARGLAEQAGIDRLKGIAGGEAAKTLGTYEQLLTWLASTGLSRDGVIYAVGGGTLTDLVGFVAATYLRGIPYRSFPTTTLAIVDASVGGKTGINLPEGKNLVGAFHAPESVVADLDALKTLPPAAFKEGLVEAFKHGLISGDEALLHPFELGPDHPGLEEYLARAVAVKIAVVEQDYRERGERRKLNLGHTLAHALEAASRHAYTHGQAVAYGLLFAAHLGRRLGGEDLVPLVRRLLEWLAPPPLENHSWSELLPYIYRDKKARREGVFWVVPLRPGEVIVTQVDDGLLKEAYREFREGL